MHVTKTILCELTGFAPKTVDVSQGDNLSRAVCCRLMANGEPWEVPEGSRVDVAYELPDGTPARYSTMPDGSAAATIDGSAVTVRLSDRIMAQPGAVAVSVVLTDGTGAQLATFPIRVNVIGGQKLRNPATYPALGAEFVGKLLYGGEDGTVEPLAVGAGLQVTDGVLDCAGGGGDSAPGQDGITPHIGENGNWFIGETDTGVAAEGEDGEDGGHYTPVVSQPTADTMRVEFQPSKAGMPAVEPVTVALPAGPAGDPGDDYTLTDDDRQEIAEIAAGMVDVPDGGGGGFSLPLLYEVTTTEEVRWIDTGDAAFTANNIIIVDLLSVATATNTEDYKLSASAYTERLKATTPYSNAVIQNTLASGLPKQHDRLFRAVGFRGDSGGWTVVSYIRTVVNSGQGDAQMNTSALPGSEMPIRGIIIGDASAASGTRVFGVGTTLKIWGC